MTITSSPKLVAIGDNCLDVYLSKGVMTVGGNALNVAVQWRRGGSQARYFGAIGRDRESDILKEEVVKAGLDSADIERRAGDTAVTLLRDDNGDRRFLLEALGAGENYVPHDSLYCDALQADWVHLGTNSSAELVRRLVADRVRFSVDVSTRHLALPLVGVPMIFASGPDDDAEVHSLVDQLRAAGASDVMLTCGSRGAFFATGDRLLHAPAVPTEVIDTCGAGDSFIATFLAAYCCDKQTPEGALHAAAAAAAETCRHLGGFPQLPRRIPDWLLAKYAEHVAPAEGR